MQCQDKRKILFIVLPYLRKNENSVTVKGKSFVAFPYGVLSIATYLENKFSTNVDIRIFECNREDGSNFKGELIETLREFQPDIVGMSLMFDNSYSGMPEIISMVKSNSVRSLIVIGGQSASSNYKEIMRDHNDIDGLCFQDGEVPMLKLLSSKDMLKYLEDSKSWITKASLETKEVEKEVLQDLNEAVDIDYSLVDISRYEMLESFSPFASAFGKNKKQFFAITSRGCPFKCTFCIHSSHKDRSMRYADVDLVVKHIERLINQYGMNVLTIYDDQLLLNKTRIKDFFRKMAKYKIRIELSGGVSVIFIDEEMAYLMKQAGVDTVNLAIESGAPYVLNNLMHKPLVLSKVKPVVNFLRKNDIWVHGYFVTGMPGETDEHRKETVKFIKEVGLDWAGFSAVTPTTGSVLYKTCIENGYIDRNMKLGEMDTRNYFIKTPWYTPEHIARETYLMNLDVNFVNNNRMKNGDYVTASKAFRNIMVQYPNHAFAHYYLAKCLQKMRDEEGFRGEMEAVSRCIDLNKDWLDYFNTFDIKDVE